MILLSIHLHLQNLARLLYESKEYSKSLQFEVDDMKQKLQDAHGDIKVKDLQCDSSKPNTLRTKEKIWFRGVFGLEG